MTNRIVTKYGTVIANGHTRIVHGGRGDYIEISKEQIVNENIYMPLSQKWRLDFGMAYYIEYRSKDKANVMIYYQTRLVNYADYKIDFYYISPEDVIIENASINKFL